MPHDLLVALVIFAVGLAAGTINTVVGSGTLITFPTLLALGYPPVLANVSNNIGLVPGVASGVHGYRAELAGQRRRIIRLGSASLFGGLVGAILLLVLPAGAFKEIVPALIGVALAMIIFQPRLARWMAARQLARDRAAGKPDRGGAVAVVLDDGAVVLGQGAPVPGAGGLAAEGGVRVIAPATPAEPVQVGGPVLWVLVFLSGVYGGYFGAAQGVLLIGLMGVAFTETVQRVNAVKNVLAGLVNGVAALVFVAATRVDWGAAGLIACGAIIGGQIGARIGRKLPPWALRLLIICVGSAALVKLLVLFLALLAVGAVACRADPPAPGKTAQVSAKSCKILTITVLHLRKRLPITAVELLNYRKVPGRAAQICAIKSTICTI